VCDFFRIRRKSNVTAKLKNFSLSIVDSLKKINISKIDFYTFAFLSLFLFVGDRNNTFVPVGLFGIHEILKRKYLKGSLYIVAGNIILILSPYLIGQILFMGYSLFAMIDLFRQRKNFNK